LLLAFRIVSLAPGVNDISGGTATLLIFLVIFGVLGVTGQVPDLVQRGKILPWKE
jgi:hypothetical protein